jgi:universal stress protein A
MRIKPVKRGRRNVLLEVGPGESRLLTRDETFQLQKILVPVDFSERSTKALRYAASFARHFGAEILCLYVIEIPYGAGEAGFVTETEMYRRNLHKEMKERMDEVIEREAADVRVKGKVRSGAPYDEITRAAQDENADLIIIATHGHTGFKRFFLGSTAERVVRHAHCPVLVVREHEHEFISQVEPAAAAKPRRKAAA